MKNWEDNLPFYWTENENKTYSDIGDVKLRFTERPARPFSGVISRTPVTWEAHLYLALWDQNKTHGWTWVYCKGVKWGFTITATATKQAVPKGLLRYTHGGAAGNKFDWIPGEHLKDTTVGGYVVPVTVVDKFGLLAPHIGISAAFLLAVAATATYAKRVKREIRSNESYSYSAPSSTFPFSSFRNEELPHMKSDKKTSRNKTQGS